MLHNKPHPPLVQHQCVGEELEIEMISYGFLQGLVSVSQQMIGCNPANEMVKDGRIATVTNRNI